MSPSTGAGRSESSRQRIIDAAASIASEVGYEGTTISKVTKRSGLPASSIYWFFKDKEQLLAEVVRSSHEEWSSNQPTWDPPEPGVPIGAQLAALLDRSVLSLPTAPDFIRIGLFLGLESRAVEPAARAIFVQIRNDTEDAIAGWFAAGLDASVLRRAPDLPQRLAQLVIAATDGLFVAFQINDAWDSSDFVASLAIIVEAAIAVS